nr:MAG: putative capsid protein [Amphisbainavirus JDuan-2023a]
MYSQTKKITGGKRKRATTSVFKSNKRFSYRKANPYGSNSSTSFRRTYDFTTGITSVLSPTLVAFNFSLNDMPGYTEIQALFELYKVNGVLFRWMPYQTESNSTGTVNNVGNLPVVFCVDNTNSTAPATVNELLEHNDHVVHNTLTNFTKWIPNPKFADSSSAARDGWISTSNASLNYFGIKMAIPPTVSAMTYYITWTIYITCKEAK